MILIIQRPGKTKKSNNLFPTKCNVVVLFFIIFRKRSFSDGNNDDCESTRDSVLSGNSQNSCDTCDPELMIIDFEYCAYNYRGFDLANHFIEWTLNYTKNEFPFFSHNKNQYPNNEQQVKLKIIKINP